MKNKRVISGIIAAASLCLFSGFPAYAVSLSLDEADKDVTVISGSSNLPEGEKLTVSVFKKGSSYDNIADFGVSAIGTIPYVAVTNAGSDGSWSIKWKNPTAGYYDVYVSDGSAIADKTEEAVFVTSGMKKKNEILLSGTKEELEDMFADKNNIISFVDDEDLASVDGRRFGTAVYNVREKINDAARINDSLELAAGFVKLNKALSADSLDELIRSIAEKGLSLDAADKYNELKTAAIGENMAVRLQEAYKLGYEEFNEQFTESLILAGVYKSLTYTDAMPFLEMTGSGGYALNKEAKAKAVVGKSFTMSELLTALNKVIAPLPGGGSSSGGGGGGGGGSFSGGSSSGSGGGLPVTSPIDKNDNAEKLPVKVFLDVPDSFWAYNEINYLRWNEILSGDEKGNFNPERHATRAEVVKILCKVFGVDTSNAASGGFGDVNSLHWAVNYINAAKALDLVKGDANNNFNPDAKITREDLAVLIYRFAEAFEMTFEKAETSFTDSDMISDYASDAVGAMAKSGIIKGNDKGAFMPKNSATRAQLAALIYRIIKMQ